MSDEVDEWATARADEARCVENPKRPPLAPHPGAPESPKVSPLVCTADIAMVPVDWLWRGRIAKGMINILDGDPGLCKSTVIADLAARGSRGEPLPGDATSEGPFSTILVSYEDAAGCVTVPRLVAAGAERRLVHAWDLWNSPLDLVDGLAALAGAIGEVNARLVVIDPLMAALPAKLNAHRDQDMRTVLAPIAALAEKTGCAFLFVRHLNKSTGGSAVYRGGGSIGIIGAARVGLLLAKSDTDNEEDRILAVTKCNVGKGAAAIKLRVVSAPSPAPRIEVACIEWGDVTSQSADSLLESSEERGELDQAVDELRDLLKDGPVPAQVGKAALRANSVSDATERRARQRLGIVAKKDAGRSAGWTWYLPEQLPPRRPQS